MSDKRKFQVKFKQARTASEKYDSSAASIEKYANEMKKHIGNIRGDDALASIQKMLNAHCDKLIEQAGRMKRYGAAARECVGAYESAEGIITGIAIQQFKSGGKTSAGTSNNTIDLDNKGKKIKVNGKSPTNVKIPGKLNIDLKDGKKGKQNAKDSQKGKEKPKEKLPVRSGWVENFDYIDPQGRCWHYKKAYINRNGVPTAYTGKTGRSKRTLLDAFEKNGKYTDRIKVGKYDHIVAKSDKDIKIFRDGKWYTGKDAKKLAEQYVLNAGAVVEAELAGASGEATYKGAEVSGEEKGKVGVVKGSAHAKFLSADYDASAKAGAYAVVDKKTGEVTLAYGINAKAGASACVAKAKASGEISFISDRVLGVQGDAEVKALSAAAEVGGCCQYIPGKGLEAYVSGGASAYLVETKVSAGVSVAGISVDVAASFMIGVGLEGRVGFKNGKFQLELGAALGVGFKLNVSIDVGKAVDYVKQGVTWALKKIMGGVMKAIDKPVGGKLTYEDVERMRKPKKKSWLKKVIDFFF